MTGAEFTRDTNYIQDRIVADPDAVRASGGPTGGTIGNVHAGIADGAELWPVEAGRYRLVAARACPWANRTIIVRRLLGLEDAISLGTPGPVHDVRSWTFDLDPGGIDPVLGTARIQENYFKRFADYPRGITVPAIVDVPSGAVVTNDYPQITLDFSTQWKEFHREGAPDLLPADKLEEMEAGHQAHLHRGQQRRLPLRLRRRRSRPTRRRTTASGPPWTGSRSAWPTGAS